MFLISCGRQISLTNCFRQAPVQLSLNWQQVGECHWLRVWVSINFGRRCVCAFITVDCPRQLGSPARAQPHATPSKLLTVQACVSRLCVLTFIPRRLNAIVVIAAVTLHSCCLRIGNSQKVCTLSPLP